MEHARLELNVVDTPDWNDCTSIRVVYNRFAELDTPCPAIFRHFHFVVAEGCLARLEDVAYYPKIRRNISRVTFYLPMSPEKLGKPEDYKLTLESEIRERFQQRLDGAKDCTYE